MIFDVTTAVKDGYLERLRVTIWKTMQNFMRIEKCAHVPSAVRWIG